MNRVNALLGVAWVAALGACAAPGWTGGTGGHMGGWGGTGHMGDGGYVHGGPGHAPWRYAEARSESLTLAVALPAAPTGVAVTLEAWLRADGDAALLGDAEVLLRIRAPDGGVEAIRMERVQSAEPGRYRAQVQFRGAGRYVVTAESWTGVDAGAPAVSVSIETDVGGAGHGGGHHGWLVPAVIGGAYMVAMMVFD